MDFQNSESNSASSNDSSSECPLKEIKICQVCGDVAKSYHFGGLCCESCKAFFRRAMQNDSYKLFSCSSGTMRCEIRKDNRRLCQYCRLQKCYSIGMDRGWLRSEEDLARMKELRLSKTKAKEVTPPANVDYAPDFSEISKHLNKEEITEIETIINLYWRAYQKVGFDPEVVQNTGPRTGLQVISMFTTGIRRWATFCKSLPSFCSLNVQDQTSMLKTSVMQMSILRAVISFNTSTSEWRIKLPVNHFSPTLDLKDVKQLMSPQMVELHIKFITSMKKLDPDEAVIMLLALITLFSNEQEQLEDTEQVARCQDRYISMLGKYCDWKYGPVDGKKTLARFLSLMTDLREISDLHSDHEVRLAHQEIVKIHEQVESLSPSSLSLNSDLNDITHFMNALEFSIHKTHHTMRQAATATATGPALHSLEKIEEICAVLVEDDPGKRDDQMLNAALNVIHKM